jgi:hypothetical protein
MKRARSLIAAFFLVTFFAGCDYVDDPAPPSSNGNVPGVGAFSITIDTTGFDNTPIAPTRKVMLEDITGHRCNNCPRAARIALGLQNDVYFDKLILVGVHAGSFAPPYPPIGDEEYDSDHRTPAGITYQQTFQVSFFPAGFVSRKPSQGSVIVSEGSWNTAIADLIDDPSSFDLEIDTIIVNAGTVSTVVRLHLAEDIQGPHNLVVYLTEDHVIDWQLDSEASPNDVPNYDHRHMLRTNLNDTWGSPVIAGSAPTGRVITVTIANAALDPAWNAANCSLVAWVYNTGTDEVMQAEERKFQP